MIKTLLPTDPTHFNVIVVGTGISLSILAAALSKAGYSVLHLDQSPIYGDESASLNLKELIALPGATTTVETPDPDAADQALRKSAHFSLSLAPSLLPSLGPGISIVKRSRVAVYLQFALLDGVAFWSRANVKGKGKEESEEGGSNEEDDVTPKTGQLVKVPMSKSDIFNSPTLSLVQKRRVTKLLLFTAENPDGVFDVPDPTTTFRAFLKDKFSIDTDVAEIIAYALGLCTDTDDLAPATLSRLRMTLRSAGMYGASPFLVGHYGGIGDLIGGFSRICAVWGGGQILGRRLGALVQNSPVGIRAGPLAVSGAAPDATAPSPPSAPTPSTATTALGIPVYLDDGEPPEIFTADWIISSESHFSTLFPDAAAAGTPSAVPHSVHCIAILSAPIPFPTSPEEEGMPDSTLTVFPPRALDERLGSVTSLQVSHSTFSAPEGYHILYLSAPLLPSSTPPPPAATLLSPYLLSLLPTPSPLLYTSYRTTSTLAPFPSPSSSSLSDSFRLVPSWGEGKTANLVSAVDDAAEVAESLFWEVVGEEGRREGVGFFVEEEGQGEEEV